MNFFNPFKKEKGPPLLELFISQGLLGRKEIEKINWLLVNTELELEDILFRYVGKDKILIMKALLYENKYEIINFTEMLSNAVEEEVESITHEQIMKYKILCLRKNEGGLEVAMGDPENEEAIEFIENHRGMKVATRYLTVMDDINKLLKELEEMRIRKKLLREKSKEEVKEEPPEPEPEPEKIDYNGVPDISNIENFTLGEKSSSDVSKGVRPVVEAIIKQGLKRSASDIHIEPAREGLDVKYRIDGVLTRDEKIDAILNEAGRNRKLKDNITNIIKNLSGEAGKTMRLDETEKPQDGRIYIPDVDLDLRVSVVPTVLGESVVLRIHYRAIAEFTLDKLGFEPQILKRFLKLIDAPYGILFASGPTGSGKTTTLYSILQIINKPGLKTMTIEDPVEYSIPGANQAQINLTKNFTFDVALRSFLRHDPDIIMVGEIRDVITANMALEAALTGHLVISSIHSNNAVSTITRLRDLGVDPRLITTTCIASLGQRLVRRVCQHCKRPFRFSTKIYNAFDTYGIKYNPRKLVKGSGCDHCSNTGYRGRIGTFELMPMTYEIKEIILKDGDEDEIFDMARKQGMKSLIEDALTKVAYGITTEEEVWRVTLLEGAYE